MAVAELEPVSERYRRDWQELLDDRKIRGLDDQHIERRERNYVDPESVVRDANGYATSWDSEVVVGDNDNGYVVPLNYDPNA